MEAMHEPSGSGWLAAGASANVEESSEKPLEGAEGAMSRWFANPDVLARPDEQSRCVQCTRTAPVYQLDKEYTFLAEVAGYTVRDKVMNTVVHEAGHAVVYMAAGYHVASIVIPPPDQPSRRGQAEIDYGEASGPWLPVALKEVAGERGEDRWLRETGRWTQGRAWVAEHTAWRDRNFVDHIMRTCHGRELAFNGDLGDEGDYAWFTDRTDEALDPLWEQVLTLADYLTEHPYITGDEAARVASFRR
jgi:hypothetical protein